MERSTNISETSLKIILPSSSFEAHEDATRFTTDSLKNYLFEDSEVGILDIKNTDSVNHVQLQKPASAYNRAKHLFNFSRRKKKNGFKRKSKKRSTHPLRTVQVPDRDLERIGLEELHTTEDKSNSLDEEGMEHNIM